MKEEQKKVRGRGGLLSVRCRGADEGERGGVSNQSSHFLIQDIWLNVEEERQEKRRERAGES